MSTREISKITAAVAFASRGLLLAISVLLLTSLGGAAIYAAPVTLPLLFLVATLSPERGWRIAATVVSALTALQVSWVTAWALSDHGLVATLIAVMVGVLVVFAFWKAGALWPHARYGEHSVRRTG